MQIVENNKGCAAFTSYAMTTSYFNTKLKYFTCLHLDDSLYVRKLVGGINNSKQFVPVGSWFMLVVVGSHHVDEQLAICC